MYQRLCRSFEIPLVVYSSYQLNLLANKSSYELSFLASACVYIPSWQETHTIPYSKNEPEFNLFASRDVNVKHSNTLGNINNIRGKQ